MGEGGAVSEGFFFGFLGLGWSGLGFDVVGRNGTAAVVASFEWRWLFAVAVLGSGIAVRVLVLHLNSSIPSQDHSFD